MTELCDLGAVDLRRMIGRGAISPVELLDSCIARIEATNPAVNAIVATCFDRGRKEAKAAEEKVRRGEPLGALHGLPVGVKDLNNTAGLRTTYGSPIFADNVPEQDERLVAAIRAAGGIVVAKTNTPEFGSGGNTFNAVYGMTGNAFDPALTCGGSSGGSGVALACSMLPLCTGSDTGGSLRKPAAWSGVVGYRPSPGLVPTERRNLGWIPLSVQGPMGRDVADAALLLSAMAGRDSRDPMASDWLRDEDIAALGRPAPLDLNALKVAFSEDLGFALVAPSIRAVFRERVALFRDAFGRAEERDPDFDGMQEAYLVQRCANFAANFRHHYERDPESLGPLTRSNYEEAAQYSLHDQARAHATQTRIYRKLQDFFAEFDLLVTPCQAISPYPKEEKFPRDLEGMPLEHYQQTSAITYGISMTGHPAVAVPAGLDARGMPFGLQLIGPRGGDAFLLSAALALEAAFAGIEALRRPVPDLDRLKG